MDRRTEHLVALVKGGSTLEDAGRLYGIGRERVRQILKAEGIRARDLPGRAQKRRDARSREREPVVEVMGGAPPRQIAPLVEAMWRGGMLYHEIGDVLGLACGDVHRLIRERVPAPERSAETAARLGDTRPPGERRLDGMRAAAAALAEGGEIDADACGHARAVIDGWLDAHPERAGSAQRIASSGPSSPAALRGELDHFKAELREGGLKESTIHSYLTGSSLFVRWLAGDYAPGSGRTNSGPGPEAAVPS
ncbi:MAG: hypothetical protein LC790_15165 [Actinobacteria bacterium]|nr:hypothetical protein [Actinomycetota bacterium]